MPYEQKVNNMLELRFIRAQRLMGRIRSMRAGNQPRADELLALVDDVLAMWSESEVALYEVIGIAGDSRDRANLALILDRMEQFERGEQV